jgi:hypothetical protein
MSGMPATLTDPFFGVSPPPPTWGRHPARVGVGMGRREKHEKKDIFGGTGTPSAGYLAPYGVPPPPAT